MKRFFFLAIAATCLLASCNKTEVVYNDGPQEIAVYAVNKVATKAPVTDATFLSDDDMRISAYIAAADGNSDNVGELFNNVLFTKKSGQSTWTGGQYWPLFNSTINFFAVTEKGGGVDNTGVSFTGATKAEIHLTNNGINNQNDLMYAIGQAKKEGANPTSVAMTFNHALAWVNFAFKVNEANIITINSVTLTAAYDGNLILTFNDYNKTNLTSNPVTAAWTPKTTSGAVVYEASVVPNAACNAAAGDLSLTKTTFGIIFFTISTPPLPLENKL